MGQADEDGFYLNCEKWTIPVYLADKKTPRKIISQRKHSDSRRSRFQQSPDFINPVPIPAQAIPDSQNDAHLVIISPEENLIWDMWGVRIDEKGKHSSNTGMTYPLNGEGVFDLEKFPIKDGESIHFYGPSRAAGVSAVAGLVFYEEIVKDKIEHKLVFASEFTAYKEFIYPPACWTDGPKLSGVPEGALIQLDPSLNLEDLKLSPAGKTIARALQEYGAVCVDWCGGNSLYAEGLAGHPEKTWQGLLDPNDLRGIAFDHFRFIESGEIIPKGDYGLKKLLEDNPEKYKTDKNIGEF